MKAGATLIVVALALAAGGIAGYHLASTKPGSAAAPVAVDSQNGAKKLLYYRNLVRGIEDGIARVDWGAGDSGYKRTIGAASIGQVHRARLKNGHDVVEEKKST